MINLINEYELHINEYIRILLYPTEGAQLIVMSYT